jgi:hypothetical protein
MRFVLLGVAVAACCGAPALAADNCEQALKDTKAAYGGSTIAPKTYAKAGELIKQAEDLCKEGKQAEAVELLRTARSMIGE